MRRIGAIGLDPAFVRRLRALFESHGFEVDCGDGDLLFVAAAHLPSNALGGNVLIIAVTDEPHDHIDALARGADESIVSAISDRELLARAQAVMRRAGKGASQGLSYTGTSLQFFPASMRVVRSGRSIALSKGEAEVLELLIRHAPASLSVERIRAEVGSRSPLTRSAIEGRLKSLRRKLGKETIANRVGFGYSWEG